MLFKFFFLSFFDPPCHFRLNISHFYFKGLICTTRTEKALFVVRNNQSIVYPFKAGNIKYTTIGKQIVNKFKAHECGILTCQIGTCSIG